MRHALRPEQRAALRAIEQCRTPAWRAPRCVRACGYEPTVLQLVPQSALPEVPVAGASALDEGRLARLGGPAQA